MQESILRRIHGNALSSHARDKGELPADGFLFGDIGLADIAVASFFQKSRLQILV